MKLRVERIHVHAVRLPLREPFVTALEREVDRPFLVVEAEAAGHSGFGEVAVSDTPYYYPETRSTARVALGELLVPRVLGREFAALEELPAALAPVRGWSLSKAGLEGALLDLWARLEGVPLWELLGGERQAVECGTSIGLRDSVEELVERACAAAQRGARRIKLKIAPGRDVQLLRAVRAALPELPLAVDGNEGYGADDLDALVALDEHAPCFLEQPFAADEWELPRLLVERSRTPHCMDDALHGWGELEHAHALGLLGVLNVKAPRMGGALIGRRAAAWASERGVGAFCGGLLDSGIGKLHALALSTCRGFGLPTDATPSSHHYAQDLVYPPIEMPDGVWRAPAEPGLGAEVDVERLRSSGSQCWKAEGV